MVLVGMVPVGILLVGIGTAPQRLGGKVDEVWGTEVAQRGPGAQPRPVGVWGRPKA